MHERHAWALAKGVLIVITALAPAWAAATDSNAEASNTDPGVGVEFSAAEVSRILQHSPLPPLPHDQRNAVDRSETAAHFGQFLFFDRRLSAKGAFSCSSCHRPDLNWTDGKQLSEGAGVIFGQLPELAGRLRNLADPRPESIPRG
jgi:cytochrome c peroxidase